MNDKPSTPVTQRRTFILGALGAAALGFVGVTFKHQYFASQSEPGDMARIKATVLVFIGAMFGRVLVGEDRADMSDRLDLFFASSAGLRHEGAVLAGYLDVQARTQASSAFVATHFGAAAAALGWVFAEWIHNGKPSVLGGISGSVAGLVAITPA